MERESNNKSCLVLLSTYNGMKYLREQIESILSQKKINIYVKVADDCSTDGTLTILEEYKKKYSNFDFYVNTRNKNFTYNFIDLLNSSDDSYDYYAFSDQDDVWVENKVISAVNLIEKQNKCDNGILYFSNQNVVDENLNFIKKTYKKSPEFKNKLRYLSQNICTGCTMVFDKKFKKLACKYMPKDIVLHDYYYFLLAVFCANYVYDNNAYINYRQHSNNLIGYNNNKISLKARINRLFKRKYSFSNLSRELLNGYSNYISKEDKKYLVVCSKYKENFASKMKLIFSNKIIPRNHKINFKIKVLINKY